MEKCTLRWRNDVRHAYVCYCCGARISRLRRALRIFGIRSHQCAFMLDQPNPIAAWVRNPKLLRFSRVITFLQSKRSWKDKNGTGA